jgi:hypothetical protein
MTLREAAAALDKTPRTVKRWLDAGKLRGEKVDGPHGPEWDIPAQEVARMHPPGLLVTVEEPVRPLTPDTLGQLLSEVIANQQQILARLDQLEAARPRPRWWPWGR